MLPPTEENYAQQQKLRELANPIPAPAPKKKGGVPEGKKGTGAAGETAPKGVKRSRDHDLEKVLHSSPRSLNDPCSKLVAKRFRESSRDQTQYS